MSIFVLTAYYTYFDRQRNIVKYSLYCKHTTNWTPTTTWHTITEKCSHV